MQYRKQKQNKEHKKHIQSKTWMVLGLSKDKKLTFDEEESDILIVMYKLQDVYLMFRYESTEYHAINFKMAL